MKRVMIPCLCLAFVLLLLRAGNAVLIPGATLDEAATAAPGAAQDPGRTIVVTSTADSGQGTLRQALLDAQSGDTITFDPAIFPPTAPVTISVNSELPHIHQGNLTIDASNAGVTLDGSGVSGDWVPGFEVSSDGNTIQGLQVSAFSGTGIVLSGGAKHNTIGGERGIGTGPFGQGNLIIHNDVGIGLWDDGTSFNTIRGSLIGTDATGTGEWGNHGHGIMILDVVSDNTIGPDNIIAYNGGDGISIGHPDSVRNKITRNSIHDNDGIGIALTDGGNTRLAAPLITDFDLEVGDVAGTSCANCTVEIFSDNSDEGETFEGQAKADGRGVFTFNAGAALAGPHLTATTADLEGNTSQFSIPTSGTTQSWIIQEGNTLPKTKLETKRSRVLPDNRIGDYPEMHQLDQRLEQLLDTGYKWQRIEILKDGTYDGEFWNVDWHTEEYSPDPEDDKAVTELTTNGISLVACLGCLKDETGFTEQGRFRTEEEIQLFHSYVTKVVAQFKGRIQYYEVWNEPEVTTPNWHVELPNYLHLITRTVTLIHDEYPEAKIKVGSTGPPDDPDTRGYLFGVLSSTEIMSEVDIVSWHPMFGTSPEYDCCRDYYYDYPSIVQEIKDVASAHGFKGEYYAAELSWKTLDNPPVPGQPRYSEKVCAKYYARGIVMHLGMDVIAGIIDWGDNPTAGNVVRNLCTTMAGNEPASLPIQIQSTATNTVSYTFSLPSGAHLIALWTDGIAVDNDPGIPATLTIPGFTEHTVFGIDVLHGFQQQLVTDEADGNLVIRDLLVKDYPLILWLYEPKYVFLPIMMRATPGY